MLCTNSDLTLRLMLGPKTINRELTLSLSVTDNTRTAMYFQFLQHMLCILIQILKNNIILFQCAFEKRV